MTFEQKKQLNSLLNLYKKELLQADERNKELKKATERGRWRDYKYNLKAQYEHARCIQAVIDRQINDEINANWSLYHEN